MLASNLKDVVVLVDKDRVKSGRYAIEKFGCDTLLLDDGFQYWKLRGRRLDIVLIDRQQPFGNERLLPRGHAARAALAPGPRQHDFHHQERRQHRASCAGASRNSIRAPGIIECIHHPLYLEDVFTGQRAGLELLKGRKVASLSGIAQPESFEQSLVNLGAELVYSQTVRRSPPLHPAGSPQRHQPQQETPGRNHRHDPKRRGPVPQTGPPRLAHLFHARRNQDPQRRRRLPGLRPQNLLPLSYGTGCSIFGAGVGGAAAGAAVHLGGPVGRGGGRAGLSGWTPAIGAWRSATWTCVSAQEKSPAANPRPGPRKLPAHRREFRLRRQDRRHEPGGAASPRGVCRPATPKAARRPGPRGCVAAIGHFGNFELYARSGQFAPAYRCATTYRGFRQPSLNRLLQRLRERSGCLFFERRVRGPALRAFMRQPGVVLGLLSDQAAGQNGLRVAVPGA